jgi:hypothetical protein
MGGGESGIRTHGRLTPTAVFKTAALNHSAISPNCVVPAPPRSSQPYKADYPIRNHAPAGHSSLCETAQTAPTP